MSLLKRINASKNKSEKNKNVADMTAEEMTHELKYPHFDNIEEMEDKLYQKTKMIKKKKEEEETNKKYKKNSKGLKVVETPMTFDEIKDFTDEHGIKYTFKCGCGGYRTRKGNSAHTTTTRHKFYESINQKFLNLLYD